MCCSTSCVNVCKYLLQERNVKLKLKGAVVLPGPSFSSSGPVRRAGVSAHCKTYHREPLYASESHLQIKHSLHFQAFLLVDFIYLVVITGLWCHFCPNLKTCYSHICSVSLLPDGDSSDCEPAERQLSVLLSCVQYCCTEL